MQFLHISNNIKLAELADTVGDRNVDYILAANSLSRSPNIGKQFRDLCSEKVRICPEVGWQKQATILNTFTKDSDVFETAALLGDAGWKVLEALGTFPGMLKIPDTVKLPDANNILGDSIPISNDIYLKALDCLQGPSHKIDPAIFNEYSSIQSAMLNSQTSTSGDPFQWFRIPWGDITLYSSAGKDSKEFPVYPEGIDDGTSASYSPMPELLYQYEPWLVYTSSGPRSNTYKFDMHRDMWTGDHRDNKCNELIRFCEANCYPEYRGSAVNIPTVTLYVKGSAHITGVMTDCSVSWDGPIGLDGWYLHCTLKLTITEVSEKPLNYSTVRNKRLIE